MSMEEDETRMIAFRYASGAVVPMALKAAIELDLFRLIENAAGSVSASELTAQLPTSDPTATAAKLDRVLRLLAAHSILSCDGSGERRYALAPVGKFFVENEDGVSFCPLSLVIQDKVLMESWYHLKDAILDGGTPFNKAHGMGIFEYAAKDGRISKILNKAMSEATFLFKKVMETYKGFEGIQTLVDVGGGMGTSLKLIVSKYPSIKAINFDLPHVINQAPPYPGIEHVGGDMFVSVPKGDAIFIKSVLHNWSDAECVRILKNCKTALPHNGKVVIAECILSEIPNSGIVGVHVEVSDMLMLAYNPGAKERTEMEFRTLAKESGFQGFRKVCDAKPTWVMELYN